MAAASLAPTRPPAPPGPAEMAFGPGEAMRGRSRGNTAIAFSIAVLTIRMRRAVSGLPESTRPSLPKSLSFIAVFTESGMQSRPPNIAATESLKMVRVMLLACLVASLRERDPTRSLS